MGSTIHISIVEDDLSVRKALRRLCLSAGYRVDAYESSECFLDAHVLASTDCLILDVHLPGKSGLELQAELVAAGIRCPTLFITAYDDEQARLRAMERGAIDFLGKPLDVERLLERIQQAVLAR